METVIKPQKSISIEWKKLWSSREILYFLIVRDIKLHYKNPLLTIAWVILQPLSIVFILDYILMQRITSLLSGHIPYQLFVLIGFLFWNYFTGSFSRATNSLIGSRELITKTYFPRILIPTAKIAVGLVDFVFVFLALIAMSVYYHMYPSLGGILLLVPCLLLTIFTSLGAGYLFAALNAKYYDVRQISPYLSTVLFYLTPVIYPIQILPPKDFAYLIYLNPFAGAFETARSAYFQTAIEWDKFAISAVCSLILFLLGTSYFLKVEKEFADIL